MSAIGTLLVIGGGITSLLSLPVGKALKASELKFGINDIKPLIEGKINLLTLASLINSIPLAVDVALKNITPKQFTLQQLFLEIYHNDVLIASQDMPITEPLVIKPNMATNIPLKITISTLPAAKLLKGIKPRHIIGFLQGDKLGKRIQVKGMVRVEKLTIPVDIKLDI